MSFPEGSFCHHYHQRRFQLAGIAEGKKGVSFATLWSEHRIYRNASILAEQIKNSGLNTASGETRSWISIRRFLVKDAQHFAYEPGQVIRILTYR